MTRRLLAFGAIAVALIFILRGASEKLSVQSPPASSPPPAHSLPERTSDVSSPTPVPERGNPLRALHVIDGDTIVLTDGRRVRYIGIDTPELSDPRLALEAEAATEANRRLVAGHDLRLELDSQEEDRYGRMLAYVWVGDVFVNEELLRQGLARLLTIPPNLRYVERFRDVARTGEANREDVWSRSETGTVAGTERSSEEECPLSKPMKGNINRRGEKIYHVPAGAFYARTRPEDCFADTEAAERAGYRASQR